jgi:hypothetical protein
MAMGTEIARARVRLEVLCPWLLGQTVQLVARLLVIDFLARHSEVVSY